MNSPISHIGRRQFLRGAGALLALPFLESSPLARAAAVNAVEASGGPAAAANAAAASEVVADSNDAVVVDAEGAELQASSTNSN